MNSSIPTTEAVARRCSVKLMSYKFQKIRRKTHFKTNLNYHKSKILFFTSNLLSKFPYIIAGEAFNMVLPEADLGLLQHPRWSSL